MSWEVLADQIFETIISETRKLFKTEDLSFLSQFARDLARERWLIAVTDDSATKDKHQKNIAHLMTTLAGEITRKKLLLPDEMVPIVIAVLRVVAQIIIADLIFKGVTNENE